MPSNIRHNKELSVVTDRDSIVYDIDRPYLLEASAGSGKTAVIVERYQAILVRQIILRGRTYSDAVRSVVAVTFTRKAADEMKERIRRAISTEWTEGRILEILDKLRRYGGIGETPDRERILQLVRNRNDLADRMSGASLSTIDAFALSILRSYPVQAGIDPFVTPEEESGIKKLSITFQDALYRSLRTWIKSADPDLAFLVRCVGYRRTRELLHRLHESASGTGPEDFEKIARDSGWFGPSTGPAGENGLDQAVLCLKDAARILEEALAGKDLRSGSRPGVERTLKPITRFLARPELDSLFHGDFYYQASVKGLVASLEPVYSRLNRVLNGILFPPLWRLAVRLGTSVRQLREQRKEITFSEMEILCRSLLRRNPDIRRTIREEREYFLVDEFQDTSVTQKELFDLILRDEQGALVVRPFFVGDPKQSIYGFRSADVGVFLRAKKEYSSPGPEDRRIGRLNSNYRSVPSVVNAVNAIFADVFGTGSSAGIEYVHQDCDPAKTDGPGDGVQFFPSKGLTLDGIFSEETRAAAALIARLVGSGCCRPKDILVLMRNRNRAHILKNNFNDILDRFGISYYHVDTENVLDMPEIRDLLVYLRALDDPASDLRILALLKSPFFRKSDPEILSLRKDGRGLREAMRNCPSAEWEIFGELAALKDRVTIPDLAWEIVRRTGYFAYLHSLRGRKEAVTNLMVFLDFLGKIQTVEMFRLTDFLYYLREYGTHLSKPQVVGEKSDVVRVMTLHQAKGLEARVVICLATSSAGNRQDRKPFRISRADPEHPVLRLRLVPGSSSWDMENGEGDGDQMEEEKRLAYVAFTRAREKFFYFGIQGEESEKKSDSWNTFIRSEKDWARVRTADSSGLILPDTPPPADSGELRNKVLRTLDDLKAKESRLARVRLPGIVTVTQLLDMEFIPGGFRNRYVLRSFPVDEALNEIADLSGLLTRRDARADIGTYLHRVFQYADPANFRDYIRLTIETENEDIRSARASIEEGAARYFDSRFYRDHFTDVRKSRAEWEINHPVTYQGVPVLIRGSIDRLLVADKGTTVIDYKLKVGSNQERYRRQLNYYAHFLDMSGIRADFLYLYDIENRGEIAVERDTDGMEDRIRTLLDRMNGVFAGADHRP